jgi:hypothetical protein
MKINKYFTSGSIRLNRGSLVMAALGVALALSVCFIIPAQATIIMDQIGPNDTYTTDNFAYASQYFETGYSDYAVVDDFSVDSANIHLTQLEAVLGRFATFSGDYNDVQWWGVEIYSSASAPLNSLAGDVASVMVPTADVTLQNFGLGRNSTFPNDLITARHRFTRQRNILDIPNPSS